MKNLIVALLLVSSLDAWSASFNCAKASSEVETMVCANAELSKADADLKRVFDRALANTTRLIMLRKEQRDWLGDVRNKCADVDCLKGAYTGRIAALERSAGAPAKSARNLIDTYAGYYSVPSELCWEFVPGPPKEFSNGSRKPCPRSARDCLRIEKVSDTQARVEIQSAQANGHSCSVNGTASLNGDALVLIDEDSSDNPADREGVRVLLGGRTVTFDNINSKGQPAPFCGFRANLEFVDFPLSARRKTAGKCAE